MSYIKRNISDAEAIEISSMSRKDFGKAVGMPDHKDVDNIVMIIKNYNRLHPGALDHVISEGRRERKLDSRANLVENPVGKKSMTLPIDLMRLIEASYPAMFSNMDHYRWFKKNFSKLDLER